MMIIITSIGIKECPLLDIPPHFEKLFEPDNIKVIINKKFDQGRRI